MSECFVVFAGGSGSMVLESLVHMTAMSAMAYDHIYALLLDVDNGNGNLTRAIKACTAYDEFQKSMGDEGVNGFFKTKIHLYRWTPFQLDKVRNSTLRGLVADDPDAMWLSRALYTQEEIEHTVPIGFKGHPNLGVVFLENLLKNNVGMDEVELFVKAFQGSQETRVMLVASSFGGTGAAAIPVFGRALKRMFAPKKDVVFALLALEPYFDVPVDIPTEKDRNGNAIPETLPIRSRSFDSKVKTVLSYYPDALFMCDRDERVYRHIYLLGSSKRIVFPKYSSGKNTQVNPANFIVWFACTAIKQFFDEPVPNPPQEDREQLHIAWLTDADWEWDQFAPDVFPGLEKKSAQLMQVAMLYISKMHIDMRNLPNVEHYSFLENLLEGCDAQTRIDFKLISNRFTDYIALLVNWFFQIASHLPKDERNAQPADAKALEDRQNSFLSFHGLNWEDYSRVFEELHLPAEEESERMKNSLLHQKFFNAMILCKLEHRRMNYWPFDTESPSGKKPPQDGSQQNSQPEAGTEQEAIANQPLGVAINRITKSRFLGDRTKVENLMAYVRDQSRGANPTYMQCYQSLIKSLFNAIEHYQN